MIIKNLQKGSRRLIYYFSFFVSLLFAVFITNIQGIQFLYIFLLFLITLINLLFYKRNTLKISLAILLWLSLWFFVSTNTKNIIDSKHELLSKQTSNYNDKVKINGQILDIFRQWDISNVYIIKINTINITALKNDILILWTINNKIRIKNGDIIEFTTKLYPISNFSSFEYDKFLIMKNIFAQTYIYQIINKWNYQNNYYKIIEQFRNSTITTIESIYPWNTVKLLNWILIGRKWDYGTELKNDFNNSWLSHIITVSWYNITIMIIFLNIFFRRLSKKIKIIIASLSVIFFIALIGDNLPAIRAWIMWIIWYIAIIYWRKLNIYSLLIFIATILIIINPLIINYDISFQLSFMALLWIITINNWIGNCLSFLPNKLQIRDSISTTISVLAFVLPIILINFWKISIISIITNLLVLPIISISMLLWSISIFAYYINASLWIFLWFPAYLFLKYILLVVWFFWKLDIATIGLDLGNYKDVFFVLYYFLLIYLILILRLKKSTI